MFDVRNLSEDKRLAAAERLRLAKDVVLPPLKYFNSSPCAKHAPTLEHACLDCGAIFRKHQRVGVSWLYFAKRGLLADSVGTGKTLNAAGLLALLKEKGELDGDHRTIIVARPGAVPQWQNQLRRFTPEINVQVATGNPKQRIETYLKPWEVILLGYQMLCRDWEKLTEFDIHTLIIDDVDALRNQDTDTNYSIGRVARECERVVDMTATPLQKKLMDLYTRYQLLGGREILGNESTFKRNYVVEGSGTTVSASGNTRSVKKIITYRNLDDFVRKTARLSLRRTARDIDDVDLPAVVPDDVFLDLYPAQRERYEELKQGVLRIMRDEGEQVKQATAIAKFMYGMQICNGLPALGEDYKPGTSVKLDWACDKLIEGDLSDEKVVVFIKFKKSVRALQGALLEAGVGFETIWGEQPDKFARQRSQDRFWQDDDCRVLIGTEAIEQSLNLQVARHLINVDMILNPARMQQLSGRIRRDGSRYKSVYVHNLLASGTQEDGYLPALEREQALADYVHGETNELFQPLSPFAMLSLIGNSGPRP